MKPDGGGTGANNHNNGRLARLIRTSCLLALASLTLMVWATVQPHPIALVLAMTVGQLLGTLALLGYLVAILLDLRKRGVIDLPR